MHIVSFLLFIILCTAIPCVFNIPVRAKLSNCAICCVYKGIEESITTININKKVGNWPTQRPMHRIPFFNTTPRFGEGVELGVGCGTTWNSSILGTICLLEPKCYLSPFTSQSQYKFCLGWTVPPGGVELGGRMWYPVKLLHIRNNLFAGTEMISLSV
jgi:hypothetical protein